jgi:hypothetical protein
MDYAPSSRQAMTDLSKVKSGDTLFVVFGLTTWQVRNGDSNKTQLATVVKAGRKYIYLEGLRAPVEKNGKSWHGDYTGCAHSNGNGFHAYTCKADYELEKCEREARSLFMKTLSCDWGISNRLPIDKINRINAILSE